MDYKGYFASALGKLRDERRYRVFADLSSASQAVFRTRSGTPRKANATS